jgi:hypothetical protein
MNPNQYTNRTFSGTAMSHRSFSYVRLFSAVVAVCFGALAIRQVTTQASWSHSKFSAELSVHRGSLNRLVELSIRTRSKAEEHEYLRLLGESGTKPANLEATGEEAIAFEVYTSSLPLNERTSKGFAYFPIAPRLMSSSSENTGTTWKFTEIDGQWFSYFLSIKSK